MNKETAKEAILKVCVEKQQELIEHFNKRIEDAQADVTSHPESPSQSTEGFNSANDVLHVMEEELAFVKYEMEILRSLDPSHHSDQVERGAVVRTDQRDFFIAVSSEEVEVNGHKIFGMSEKAPLYAQMRGLKKGDTFQFNATKYKILDIY
jgi:transcription elongation GreA/GreB family factor